MHEIGQQHEVPEDFAARSNGGKASVAQVALAWCLAKPGVQSPIIGARTMDQLESNLAAAQICLTTDQIERLDGMTEPPDVFLVNCVHASVI